MPNLPTHIHLSHQLAQCLDWPDLQEHLGSCFLGSTAPDIRAMAKWTREHTHFAPLSVQSVGAGVRRMFELHPELLDHGNLSGATRAFVLGYLSHLVADEHWIINVFRPYFGNPSPVAESQVEAHIWDRALQLDLDRKAHQMLASLYPGNQVLATAEQGVELAFLEPELLLQWREWVCRFMGWEFTWDRLKRALNRMYRDDGAVQREVDRFLQGMPGSLERVYARVPEHHLATYQREVLEETLVQVREYWGGA